MIEKKLMDFLCRETSPEQLKEKKLLHLIGTGEMTQG